MFNLDAITNKNNKNENAGVMMQLHVLNISTLWMKFTAILMITTQKEREKSELCLMV